MTKSAYLLECTKMASKGDQLFTSLVVVAFGFELIPQSDTQWV